MSSYIEFFIRGKNDIINFGAYSRNSAYYEIFSGFVPYGRVCALDHEKLNSILRQVETQIDEFNSFVKDKERLIKEIATFNNTVAEKIDWTNEYLDEIRDLTDRLNEYQQVKFLVNFLINIVSDAELEANYSQQDVDPAHLIFAGEEVWNVTMEDLKEWGY